MVGDLLWFWDSNNNNAIVYFSVIRMFSIIVVSFKIKSHKSSRLHRKLNSVPGQRAFEHFDSNNERAERAE